MTEKEKLMYNIISRISNVDAPIIFKGALITKLILSENGYTDVQRMTKDIDANWIGTPPSMKALADIITRSLGDLKKQLHVEISREYGIGKSAGLILRDNTTGDKVVSMDIDIKQSVGNKIYYFGEASIKGVLADEILSDKISSMSSDAVYKHRAKDIIDVYSLAHCVTINVNNIYEVCRKTNREIQSFDAFFNRKNDIEHAYNKLRGIDGKPPFNDVYSYLCKFISPFAKKEFSSKIWNHKFTSWEDETTLQKENKEIKG